MTRRITIFRKKFYARPEHVASWFLIDVRVSLITRRRLCNLRLIDIAKGQFGSNAYAQPSPLADARPERVFTRDARVSIVPSNFRKVFRDTLLNRYSFDASVISGPGKR